MNGILIVFDGIDGAGKTTQAQILAYVLRALGESVVTSKEPTNGQFGRQLRESAQSGRLSLKDELRLFIADREEHVSQVIQPALEVGSIVILDRYYYSTVAYQGQRGADRHEVIEAMRFAPVPDVAFFIDAEPSVCRDRIRNSRGDLPNHFEGHDELTDIREIFLWIARRMKEVIVVDGSPTIPLVFNGIARLLINGVLAQKRHNKGYDWDAMVQALRTVGESQWVELFSGNRSAAV